MLLALPLRKDFARADLEHTLLCVDDDMRMEALRQTNYVKSIVTAQGQMDLECDNWFAAV